MRPYISMSIMLFALNVTGCKKVEVYDVETYADNVCVAHEVTAEHPSPIECFGNSPTLPFPSDTSIYNMWSEGIRKPVSISTLAGVCVVDEDQHGKGTVKCIDKFSPSVDTSRMLTATAKEFLSGYDVERIEYAPVSNTNLDYLGCGLAKSIGGPGNTLVCWTKLTRVPIDLVIDDVTNDIFIDIVEITDFSMAREQLCILGVSQSGPLSVCMQPTVLDNKVAFTNVDQSLNISASRVAAGGISGTSAITQSWCYTSRYGDIGCHDPELTAIPSGEYSGIWMGPKNPSLRSQTTVCVSSADGVECAGQFATSILTENLRTKAKNVKRFVISDEMTCLLAKPKDRSGIYCEGYGDAISVPSHLTL